MRIRSVELRVLSLVCVRVMRVDCMCRPVRVTERTPQQNRVEVCVHEPYNLVFNSLLFLSCEKVKRKRNHGLIGIKPTPRDGGGARGACGDGDGSAAAGAPPL